MRNRLVLISLTLTLAFGSSVIAQEEKPKIPYIDEGACPFECCQYGTWTAESPLVAYQKEENDSAIAFKIKPGESFTAINGNVHITKPGYVVVNRSFDGFTKDDKVYLLTYLGEGAYDLWYKGKKLDLNVLNADDFWANVTEKDSPLYTWAVLITRGDGKQGWLRLKNSPNRKFWPEKIKGMDSCS
jgi:hypothetical protein